MMVPQTDHVISSRNMESMDKMPVHQLLRISERFYHEESEEVLSAFHRRLLYELESYLEDATTKERR